MGGSRFDVLPLIAVAVIAIVFQPVRNRAQRLVDRLVYGKRATPYEVLSQFSERMGGTYSADDVLPRMVQLIVSGTSATRAEVWLRVGASLRLEAWWPQDGEGRPEPIAASSEELPPIPEADRTIPVVDRGQLLGAIAVRESRSDPITPPQEELLSHLAAQAALVLRNVGLIEELRASRQRLVAAQDQERRRLERNIHDGAPQQLVALAVKLGPAERLVARDPSGVEAMLRELRGEAQSALEDLRDLARGIYPPLLADQGLAAALEAQARRSPVPVTVERDGVGRYPQEVEAAIYFCVLEALQNIRKYAQASHVEIRLRAKDRLLLFEVADDGRGFDPQTRGQGSGLQNMADRMAALGGHLEVTSQPGTGTKIQGRIPVVASR